MTEILEMFPKECFEAPPKRVPFSGWRYIKGKGFNKFKTVRIEEGWENYSTVIYSIGILNTKTRYKRRGTLRSLVNHSR